MRLIDLAEEFFAVFKQLRENHSRQGRGERRREEGRRLEVDWISQKAEGLMEKTYRFRKSTCGALIYI
jgi:hypothetical protein